MRYKSLAVKLFFISTSLNFLNHLVKHGKLTEIFLNVALANLQKKTRLLPFTAEFDADPNDYLIVLPLVFCSFSRSANEFLIVLRILTATLLGQKATLFSKFTCFQFTLI